MEPGGLGILCESSRVCLWMARIYRLDTAARMQSGFCANKTKPTGAGRTPDTIEPSRTCWGVYGLDKL